MSYFLKLRDSPVLFVVNLATVGLLLFLACSSLIICIVRDPGAVRAGEGVSAPREFQGQSLGVGEDLSVTEALLMPVATKTSDDDDFNSPLKWCKKCWAPKPERTHHCSVCKRCVLKMGMSA